MAKQVTVYITGAQGQLGQSFYSIYKQYPGAHFIFLDRKQLDIADRDAVFAELDECDVLINCAAYTQVDNAEDERSQAYAINKQSVAHLADKCAATGALLVHFSSDYVYHNHLRRPLQESDPTRPKGVYARSKLAGEKEIENKCDRHLIFRVSWLYGPFGSNFPKTMLRLAKDRPQLSIVNDQIGAPTNTLDLAHMVLKLVASPKALENLETKYGTYNYCNSGATSWDEIAKFVFQQAGLRDTQVLSIPSAQYPTKAKRPRNSQLDLSKWKSAWDLKAHHWQKSMARCIDRLMIEST